MHLLIIIATLIITLVFMFLTYLIFRNYFYSIIFPLNTATRIFFISALFGSGMSLYLFSESGISLLNHYYETNHLGLGIGVFLVGVFICFCFNIVIFRTTILINKISIFENEHAELAKGNLLIAGIQSITFLIFIFLLSGPLIQLILRVIQ